MTAEVLVNWTTAGGGGFVSVLHFDEVLSIVDARADLDAFLLQALEICANTTSYQIATEGKTFNPATGTLTGFWSDPTPHIGTGIAGNQAADATQALVRWRTDTIINGRLVQGRTFIPGVGAGEITSGNLNSGAQATLQAAATALVTAPNSQLYVWHRPNDAGPGDAVSVTSAGVWNELAVLRRRRG